jgi:hypothetical protein
MPKKALRDELGKKERKRERENARAAPKGTGTFANFSIDDGSEWEERREEEGSPFLSISSLLPSFKTLFLQAFIKKISKIVNFPIALNCARGNSVKS